MKILTILCTYWIAKGVFNQVKIYPDNPQAGTCFYQLKSQSNRAMITTGKVEVGE